MGRSDELWRLVRDRSHKRFSKIEDVNEEQEVNEGKRAGLGKGLEDIMKNNKPTNDLSSIIPSDLEESKGIRDNKDFRKFLIENISEEDLSKYWKMFKDSQGDDKK